MASKKTQSINPYEKLAEVLDKIPNAFTKDNEGLYLKVLQWIFTSEEAFIASQMKLKPETADELSKRLKIPRDDLERKLTIMSEKGQIASWGSDKGNVYRLLPFAVGIYEMQMKRMDKNFAQLIERYFAKTKLKGLFGTKPAVFKVIPVKKTIKTGLTIHPYEDVEQMIMNAKSWGIGDCVCKKQKRLIGKSCKYPQTVCMTFSPDENTYTEESTFKAVTKEKALELLHKAEEAGLVHCSMNTESAHSYICNCCTCCCGILRGLTEFKQPYAIAHSDYIMSVNEELCIGCGSCLERCQFNAIYLEETAQINERCLGCGVCAIACTENALKLIRRSPKDIVPTPKTNVDWLTEKATSRGVDASELLK